VTHQHAAAPGVQVGLGERERLVDPQTGSPEHDEQPAHPPRVTAIACAAHHGHDVIDGRRIRRLPLPLVVSARPAW
jgi:hypothetical protein